MAVGGVGKGAAAYTALMAAPSKPVIPDVRTIAILSTLPSPSKTISNFAINFRSFMGLSRNDMSI
jgi:hypothetical protein